MMMEELRPVTYKEGWVLRLFHLKKSEEGYIIAAFGYLKGRCRKDWGRLLLGVHSRELWGERERANGKKGNADRYLGGGNLQ